MDTGRWLLVSGAVLLSVSALIGFVQYRYREQPETFALWRVVHTGGTAGAVQLIALYAVWGHLRIDSVWAALENAGLVVATWAFFLGPLAGALGRRRAAQIINRAGAAVAVPAYVFLPIALLW